MRTLDTAHGTTLDPHRFKDLLTNLQIIPVVTVSDAGDARPLADALSAGGLGCIEVTLRTPAAIEAIAGAATQGDVIVGAGTVTSSAQVSAATRAGASFVVSPGYDETVARRCAELDVPYLPGVATPTELMSARAKGFDVVKFFPAEPLGGLALLKAFAALFAEMRFVPTGGVDRERAAAYLAHPAVPAVGGSWMVPQDALAQRDWPRIEELARDALRHCTGVLS